ncbi:uncharacterized protein [Halyomorpha halys]|uniref:uncharacterized protein n=1 Tax=Halyomorpha halys TaxID=286706 RepID=UPI0006D519F6
MATYCRITGKSRGLPKPNYFPLLPPISPADAKRFCRITGKAYGLPSHHYIPVLVGKPRNRKQSKPHIIINGYKYFFPCLHDAPNLQEILDTKTKNGKNAQYVYTVKEKKCSLVFTAELEAAVRDGDVRDVMLAKDNDTVLLKLKQGDVSLEMKEIDVEDLSCDLYEGEGVAIRKDNTATGRIRKIFEDKEMVDEPVIQKKPKKEMRSWKRAEISKVKIPTVSFESWVWDQFEETGTSPVITRLPTPVSVAPISLDLSQSKPGLIQQPYMIESYIGLEPASVIAPFKPLIIEPDSVIQERLKCLSNEELAKTLKPEILLDNDLLPHLEEISQITPLLEKGSITFFESGGESVGGVIVDLEGKKRMVVGQELVTEDGKLFVPGQTVLTPCGHSFVPGFVVESHQECKIVPGEIFTVEGKKVFLTGTTTLTNAGEKFVQGQFMSTPEGIKFVPGQTVYAKNELRFVAGQITADDRFLPGLTNTTSEGTEFVPGQYVIVDGNKSFVPGQSIWTERGWEFMPGKTVITEEGKKFVPGRETKEGFMPGQFIIENGKSIFVPGKTVEEDILKFVPGMTVETKDGSKFVQGQVVTTDSGQKFVPGRTELIGNEIEFVSAKNTDEILFENTKYIERNTPVFSEGVFGHMVQSKLGVEFFPGSAVGLPAGKVVPGKLIRGEEVKFVPGLILDGVFVPGQVVMTDSGEEFIPGQVIETSEGPKFVPGQIIQCKGVSKFVPGQTVQTADGPKFVPGQIVETKSGPTFIPGQVIYTEEGGSKFVPGEVVETSEGPRFVPGRVVEAGDHVTFVPGQVVETNDGLKFIAPDLIGDSEEDREFTVQGFEISPEELGLLQPRSCVPSVKSWEMSIDSKMLRQLSEAGMGIGRQVSIEVPAVDVKTAPAMSVACALSKKLALDPVTTLKISQIIVAVVQLGKLGEIPGSSEECNTLNRILERVVHCKNDEEAYKLISNIIEKEFSSNMLQSVDRLHSYITSKDSPLKRLNKLNILKELLNCHSKPLEVIDKLNIILNDEEGTVCCALQKLSETSPEIVPLIMERLSDSIETLGTEREVVDILHKIIVSAVREASEMNIVDLLKDTENLNLKSLILEAVGLAKALDMHDTAVALLGILSNPKCTDILAGDRLTLEILRRLTVMRQLAARKPELIAALKKLHMDPYGARSDPSLRQLVRESGALLVVPEDGISSKSVPSSLFFSQNSLAMEEFLTRTKRIYSILVIIKNGIQAVIPREAAHSVLTGSVPYVVLDEKGLHHFQPKHVFSALKLPKIATHWFSSYKCEMVDTPLKSVIETK